MSSYSGNSYQPHAQTGYYDQYGQHQQTGQNGGYQRPYAQEQGQQPAHQQYQYATQYAQGGAVQQPTSGSTYQEPYQSPQNATFASQYGSPQHQYNPQDYAQPPSRYPPQQQTYNPAAYANVNQGPYSQQHNPAVYPEMPLRSTSGPVDPYAYASNSYGSPQSSYAASAYSPRQPQYQQSVSPRTHYPPQPPAHDYDYTQAQSSPPQQHSQYAYPASPTSTQYPSVPYPTSTYRPHSGSLQSQARPGAFSTTAMPGSTVDDGRWRPSPPSHQSSSPHYGNALPSPPGTTPGPTPPAHGPSRSNTMDRHPQDRPLPPQPGDYFEHQQAGRSYTGFNQDDEDLAQAELYDEVENALMNAGRGSAGGRSPSISISQAPFQPPGTVSIFNSRQDSRASRNGTVNGHLSPLTTQHMSHDTQYSSDSDVEATQGLAMMQLAEDEDARRQSGGDQSRFNGYGSQRASRGALHADSDSDDYGAVDMSSFGGGPDNVHLTYGGDPSQLAAGGEAHGEIFPNAESSQHSSMRRSRASQSSQMSRGSYDYRSESGRAFPAFNPAARVEVGGTGGLQEPSVVGRRKSYDEGDEYSFTESQLPDRFPDEPPDIFFHQASSSFPSRPLPAVPYPDEPSQSPHGDTQALPPLPGQPPYPVDPGAYMINAQGQYVPRSTSLVSHSNTPQVPQPLRSKTDAEERRLKQLRGSAYSSADVTPASASVIVDLPAIGKRFTPSKLGAPDFKKCDEPWSLMSLLKWLLQVTSPEQNTELKEADVKEALVALFTNKVPTMNIADAEGLSDRVVEDMYQATALVTTEEWVRLVPKPISGVIFQLTRSGCYAPTVHNHVIPDMRCYSHLCQRTLKKVNLQAAPKRTSASWVEYFKLSKEDLEGKDKKLIELQNNLHEIVASEEKYMADLAVLQSLYRDQLARVEPSVINPKKREKFLRTVFGRVDAVKKANEEHLFPQLKYRQQEQGPWIVGFSDIFRQWIRKARTAYMDYATEFPRADYMVRQELSRNIEFRNFVQRAERDPSSDRLSIDNFLKAPTSRIQRYPLLLSVVLKNMKAESPEKTNLQIALEEVRAVVHECDARFAEATRKTDLSDLQQRLVLRPSMQDVELQLDHFGRQLIHRGDLQRMGSTRFTWLDCHVLLFDHYLILAKAVAHRTSDGAKLDRYDVSRFPIPMDLLALESASDPPVQKSSYIKGITSVREAAGRNTPMDPSALGRTTSNQSPAQGNAQHANAANSTNTLNPVTSLGEVKDSDRILFPFRIKHLGRESYTLFALTDQARKEWTSKIIEAKTKHAAALHAQNAEPFRLRVMADSAFVYEGFAGSGKGVTITGTPVDRAIKDVEHRFKDTGRPGPICRARVNCATSFSTPYPGKQMVAVGTDYGVYISELDNPRGWTKAINMSRVTQVAVLEEFNLFLLISDKSLIAYHLDIVCPSDRNGPAPANDSARKAPQKLSGSRDVGFFVTGKMKDRTLVFYKKRENLNSVFKVLEPVYQKASDKKRVAGMFKRGNTEFFREYDEFYIPAECTGTNLFQSSLAVSTARGFEVLTLDKKQPWSVPELKAEHVQAIAQTIKDQKALSMLRLSEQEFLLCYANCAVYVNKHGDVSRSVIMEFVGNAQAAALYGPYLVLFDSDFVEVRNAQNGRLKQIISGREVKCLDDGGNWSANNGIVQQQGMMTNGGGQQQQVRTLKLVMQHPEVEKCQIVVELVLNENMKE